MTQTKVCFGKKDLKDIGRVIDEQLTGCERKILLIGTVGINPGFVLIKLDSNGNVLFMLHVPIYIMEISFYDIKIL